MLKGVVDARPVVPTPLASVPSQSPEPPVIETQKSESAVPMVPKMLREFEMERRDVVAFGNVEVAVVDVAVKTLAFTIDNHAVCNGWNTPPDKSHPTTVAEANEGVMSKSIASVFKNPFIFM